MFCRTLTFAGNFIFCKSVIERPSEVLWFYVPETARRVFESTGMAHCAIPRTNSSRQASSNRINCNTDYKVSTNKECYIQGLILDWISEIYYVYTHTHT